MLVETGAPTATVESLLAPFITAPPVLFLATEVLNDTGTCADNL